MKIISHNADETKNEGRKLAQKLKPGDVALLYGDLGSGKTTFVQGMAEGLGIQDRILSPTFVLQRIHDVKNRDFKYLNHMDLYRLDEPTEIKNLGVEEIFDDNQSVTIIEWAEKLSDYHLKKGYKISFKYIDDTVREICIESI